MLIAGLAGSLHNDRFLHAGLHQPGNVQPEIIINLCSDQPLQISSQRLSAFSAVLCYTVLFCTLLFSAFLFSALCTFRPIISIYRAIFRIYRARNKRLQNNRLRAELFHVRFGQKPDVEVDVHILPVYRRGVVCFLRSGRCDDVTPEQVAAE